MRVGEKSSCIASTFILFCLRVLKIVPEIPTTPDKSAPIIVIIEFNFPILIFISLFFILKKNIFLIFFFFFFLIF